MKKNNLILCLVIVLVLSFSGCGSNTDNHVSQTKQVESRIVFGFSQLGDESEWRSAASADIKKSAEEAGVQILFENAQQKQTNQIKAIRSFIVNRVDVIAFSPIVEEGWDNILMEAKQAGIPVILVDRYIKTQEDGLYCAFIGFDFEKEGQNAGKWVLEKFKDVKKNINIAEIVGTSDSSPAIGRHDGFLEAIGKDSRFKIINSVSGDFMRSKGGECMETILEETPVFDVLYAHNDDMALGAIEILEEHGIKPGKDVVVVSVDAQQSGLDALKAGKINCLVECSPYIGDQLIDLVKKVANGEDFPEHTVTNGRLYTETDDFSTLPDRP